MNLKNDSSRAQYVSECLSVVKNVDRLSSNGMHDVLINAVNARLKAAGVPRVTKAVDGSSGANAVFDFQNWCITFGSPLMAPASLTTLRLGVNTVYHEARHCEQWFRMAQGVAAGKLNKEVRQRIDSSDAGDIAAKLWLPPNIAAAAMADTDYHGNSDREVQAWWRSVYANSAGIRGRKLGHINERYEAYRNLPEEVDAWALGDGVEEQFAARCPKLGCPTYAYWKKATYRFWFGRSGELVNVDKALKSYDKSKSASDRSTLKTEFDKWHQLKMAKGGTRRAQGNYDAVSQLKAFLDQFGATGAPSRGVKVM